MDLRERAGWEGGGAIIKMRGEGATRISRNFPKRFSIAAPLLYFCTPSLAQNKA